MSSGLVLRVRALASGPWSPYLLLVPPALPAKLLVGMGGILHPQTRLPLPPENATAGRQG